VAAPDREGTLRDAIDAVNRGELESAIELFHPDAEWRSPEEWLEREVYRGYDGIREIGKLWLDNFDDYRWDVERMVTAGDTTVVLARQRGRSKEHGVPLEAALGFTFEWSGERVIRAATYNDWDEALAAAGTG
jgi:ketosteroid isomerase-like protein